MNAEQKLLPFTSIHDLISKVEKIKETHEYVSRMFRGDLMQENIEFDVIGQYSVSIDISKVPQERHQILENKYGFRFLNKLI